ncbi:MAG: hypothetical protein KDD90_01050 [Sphingomonadaceae bacterium]|jgi:hypothetical protein|nr:hypothetical protein [Sphingomonadaceae bacterium]
MTGNPYTARFRILWPLGLVLFGIVIWMGLPLDIEGVPGGILAHQAAGSGHAIDLIQRAWSEAGLYERARYAMYGDILFITVYGLGSWYGGLHYMQDAAPKIRRMGGLLVAAAAVFMLTDYTETFSQIIQLTQQRGSDTLASIAATVRPVKVAAWLVTFFGVIATFVVRRISARTA